MKKISLIATALWLGSAAWCAAQSTVTPDQLSNLQKQVDSLKQQVDDLKTTESVQSPKEKEESKLEWGGFGEMAYQNFGVRGENGSADGLVDGANLTRISLDGIYHYNDWVQTKFEFEALDAGVNALNAKTNSDKAAFDIEQAYTDFKFSEPLGVRAGLVVIPMGLINEHHRPQDFDGVFRPSVETFLIPSTWREMGAGIFGTVGENNLLTYRSYAVTGLDATTNGAGVKGLDGSEGLKGGRSLGAVSIGNDGAWVSRLDYSPMKDVALGGSYYIGEMGQGQLPTDIPITIWDVHASAEYMNARLKAVWVQTNIANAGEIDRLGSGSGGDPVGNKEWGGYVMVDYNLLPALNLGELKYLNAVAPYFRYERYDTADNMPLGFHSNGANTRREWTVGLNIKPIKQIVLKMEYQWLNNEAHTPFLNNDLNGANSGVHEWNMGLGYQF